MKEKAGAKKKVVLVARRSPLNSVMAAESLRQAVGLTLADNDMAVVLMDAGAWLAVPLAPQVVEGEPIPKHLGTLLMLGVRVLVERESLEKFGIPEADVIRGIQVIPRQNLLSELAEAEAVVNF